MHACHPNTQEVEIRKLTNSRSFLTTWQVGGQCEIHETLSQSQPLSVSTQDFSLIEPALGPVTVPHPSWVSAKQALCIGGYLHVFIVLAADTSQKKCVYSPICRTNLWSRF